jgi:hypothetical protein
MHNSVLGFQLYITRLKDDYKDQWKATFVALGRDIRTATSVHNITPALSDDLLLLHRQLFAAAHFAIIYLLFDHEEYSDLPDTHHSPPIILIKAQRDVRPHYVKRILDRQALEPGLPRSALLHMHLSPYHTIEASIGGTSEIRPSG